MIVYEDRSKTALEFFFTRKFLILYILNVLFPLNNCFVRATKYVFLAVIFFSVVGLISLLRESARLLAEEKYN